MGKFSGILLASDFDDTLYDFDHRIPDRNLQAIRYFTSEGGRFTVSTGRAQKSFAPYADMALINAPVVLSNGATLYDFAAGKAVFESQLPDTALEDLGRLLRLIPELGAEIYFGEEAYVWNPNDITRRHLAKVGCSYINSSPSEVPRPWMKAILQQRQELLLRAQQWLLSRYSDRYEAIFSNPNYLEITCKGYNKGGMVERLAGYLGIAPEHVYCVGDNQNDIPMLERSAIPFAPSNCAPEVREWGAEVLCHCNDGVIGDIVDILDRIYP